MRAAVTAVLAATAALTLPAAAGADSPGPVVPRFGISTAHTQGMRNHHGYAMRVDTIGLDKLAGANVKVRCLGVQDPQAESPATPHAEQAPVREPALARRQLGLHRG